MVLKIKLRLLRWEINLDYPNEPDVIIRVLKSGKGNRREERTAEEWSGKCNSTAFRMKEGAISQKEVSGLQS